MNKKQYYNFSLTIEGAVESASREDVRNQITKQLPIIAQQIKERVMRGGKGQVDFDLDIDWEAQEHE